MIIANPYILIFDDAELYADLAAEKPISTEWQGQKIVVGIKSFVGNDPLMICGSYPQPYLNNQEVNYRVEKRRTANRLPINPTEPPNPKRIRGRAIAFPV